MIPIMNEVSGCPRNDFMSIWANAEIDGQKLPPESVMHEVGLFIAGGAETTRTAISHGLREFCNHPAQWEEMAKNPALIDTAVEEVLRWVTPLNNFFRTALTDDHVGGQDIAAGDRVVMLYPRPIVMKQYLMIHSLSIFIETRIHISLLVSEHTCVSVQTWHA